MPELWSSIRVLPLVTFTRTDNVADYGQAVAESGLTAIEVGLRTPQAIDAIRILRENTPLTVVAGTLTTPELVTRAVDAGAHAGVSPNWDPGVIQATRDHQLPFAPGIATPSELGQAVGQGFVLVKVFPVRSLGGTGYLNALSSVFPDAGFLPSGGIAVGDISDYLVTRGVRAVTGSFLPSVTEAEIDLHDLAQRARALADLEESFR